MSLLLALACLAAGCGSADPDAAAESPERMVGWRAEANRICQEARFKAERLGDEFPTDPAGTLEYLRALNGNFHDFIAELRRVEVASDDSREYEEMTDRYEGALEAQEALAAALEAGDSAAAEQHNSAVTRWGDRGDTIALRLSLKECALDPGEDVPFESSP